MRATEATSNNATWSALANFFRAYSGSSFYVDLPCFYSPSIITGDIFRPDLILVTADKQIYTREPTVGFETNLRSECRAQESIISVSCRSLKSESTEVKFVNLSISSLGIRDLSCSSFIDMYDALAAHNGHQRYLISKL